MTKKISIKVCGLNDVVNMKQVDDLGVDYLGMIFYEKSPRFVKDDRLQTAHTKAIKVGVFVNASLFYINQVHTEFGIQIAQLHGSESPSFCKQVKQSGLNVWKVFGIDGNFDFSILKKYPSVDLFLFDTKSPLKGGTGLKFDWKKLQEIPSGIKFMLSGGIDRKDADLINQLNLPGMVGIDLNSKFEISPGIKNAGMLENFIDQLE
jgi:phosphoribosylanthranilate isomerase